MRRLPDEIARMVREALAVIFEREFSPRCSPRCERPSETTDRNSPFTMTTAVRSLFGGNPLAAMFVEYAAMVDNDGWRGPEHAYGLRRLKRYGTLCSASDPDVWKKTRSCWQDSRHVSVDGKRRQRGVCAALHPQKTRRRCGWPHGNTANLRLGEFGIERICRWSRADLPRVFKAISRVCHRWSIAHGSSCRLGNVGSPSDHIETECLSN